MQFISKNIENYAIDHSSRPSELCEKIADYTRKNIELPQMLTGPLEMSFIGFLIKSMGIKNILEIGTFTGYSALAMAENLPEDGNIITLDINESTGSVARGFWNQSSHAPKIKQIIAPALDTLEKLDQKFDLVFIDADKSNYVSYVSKSLDLLSKNGIVIVDNVLWSGKVLEEDSQDISTHGIKQLNKFVLENKSLSKTMLPIRDGIYLIQKN